MVHPGWPKRCSKNRPVLDPPRLAAPTSTVQKSAAAPIQPPVSLSDIEELVQLATSLEAGTEAVKNTETIIKTGATLLAL